MNHVLFADALSEIRTRPRLSAVRYPKRRIILPVAAVCLFAGSLLFMTFVHVGTWIQGYTVAVLEQKQDQLLRDLQALKLEEAVLKRPERIRKLATQQLNLIPAAHAPLIRVP